jgi:DNA-binding GntR family transcriptional regulator
MTRHTLTNTLRDQLEQEILTGELAPGSRLDEVSLAARFNVSRTPVREALRQLAASDLVVIRPRQTPMVAPMTVQTLLQMFEVMAELEGLCARLTTRRISIEASDRLVDTQNRLREALEKRDVKRFYDINHEFHEIIYDASANPFLANQTRSLRNRLAPFRRQVTGQPGRMALTILEHQAVIDAIVSGASEAAGLAMRNHVNLLGDSLTDFVAGLPQGIVNTGAPEEGARQLETRKNLPYVAVS